MHILKNLFLMVLFSSISASLFAIMILLMKKIFVNKIKPRIYCILWFLVLIKVIVTPFAPASHISVFNILNHVEKDLTQKNTTSAVQPLSSRIEKQLFSGSNNKKFLQSNYTTAQTYLATMNNRPLNKGLKKSETINIVSIFSVLWFLGFLITISATFCAGINFSKKVNFSKKKLDPNIRTILNSCYCNFALDDTIPIFTSSFINSPCVLGTIKPRIMIPEKLLLTNDYKNLAYMLMHELGHFKRRDNLANIIVVIANSINWFNPILWYASMQLHSEKEICCDTYALELLGQEESISYGMTLIHFGRQPNLRWLSLNFSSFFKKTNDVEKRILMIKKFKRGSYKISAVAIAICLMTGFITLTNGWNPGTAASTTTDNAFKSTSALYQKEYYSLQSVPNYDNFKFKVPDFIPEGYSFDHIGVLGDKLAALNYVSQDKSKIFNLQIATTKPKYENLTVKEGEQSAETTSEQIGNVEGSNITITTSGIYTADKAKSITTSKYFLWQDDNLWYSICYYGHRSFGGKLSAFSDLSADDLKKVIISLKYPQDVKGVNYFSTSMFDTSTTINGNSQDSIDRVKKGLNFTPKLPASLSSYVLSRSIVNSGNVNLLTASYCTPEDVSKQDSIPSNGFQISEWRENPSVDYEKLVRLGYAEVRVDENGSTKKVNLDKFNISGVDVYCYTHPDFTFENGIISQSFSEYFFVQDNLTFTVNMFGSDKNHKILKALIASE